MSTPVFKPADGYMMPFYPNFGHFTSSDDKYYFQQLELDADGNITDIHMRNSNERYLAYELSIGNFTQVEFDAWLAANPAD